MFTSQRSSGNIQNLWQATQTSGHTPTFGLSQRSSGSSSSGFFPRTIRPSRNRVRPPTPGISGRNRVIEDEDDNSEMREVCMTVCIAAGRIGAAYYDPQYGDIYVLEDIVESYVTCDVLQALISHVQPTNVVAAAKQDEKVMYHLKTLCLAPASASTVDDEPSNGLDTNMDKPRLTLVRAWDFGYTTCKKRICTVIGNTVENGTDTIRRRLGRRLENDTEEDDGTVARVRAAFSINFDASCMVRALGALLKFLNLKRLGNANFSLNSSMNTSCASENSREKTLMIDVSTFEGLQIFQQQYHPSVYKAGRSGMKEGVSLFNICDYCRSGPGSLELRRWFLRPSTDVATLEKRLDAVEFLVDDNNDEIMEAMSKTLQRVRYLTAVLNRMRTGKASVRDWSCLYKTLMNCCRLGDLVRMKQKRPELLTELAESFGQTLQDTCALLASVIDFEGSRKENRFVVLPEVDEELDARKDFLARLPDVLAAVAREEMALLAVDLVEECRLIYMPLLGYLLTLPHTSDSESDAGSLFRDEGLQLVFVAENVAHYKSEACRKLDDEFGDVKFKIIDRETSIMLNLQNVVVEQASVLLDAVRSAAQLDCLISLAIAAKSFNWTKPTVTEENRINIEDGRHPLQELMLGDEQFVANPVRSGGSREGVTQPKRAQDQTQMTTIRQVQSILTPSPKVHLLTGPNASGKSVYLKQVGLLVYMAHIGCFVPAKKAEVGVLDGIYSRLRTVDSITGGMSSFAIDLRQMSSALKQATGRSLILIDEFGKGTAMEIGCGLLASSLEYWLEKQADECPHVYVCSHLYRVIGLLPQSPLLQMQTMSIEEKDNELVFLFKLIDGIIDSSLAVYTAQAAGLPFSVLQRSAQVFDSIKSAERIRRSDMTAEQYKKEYERMSCIVEKFMAINLDDTTLKLDEVLRDVVADETQDFGGETMAFNVSS